MTENFVRANCLVKRYGTRAVLDGVDFEAKSSETVLIAGDNGSGKTTLLEILSGHCDANSGELVFRVDQRLCRIQYPFNPLNPIKRWRRAGNLGRLGVRRLWQDSRLFPSLSVLENLMIARISPRMERLSQVLLHPLRAQAEEQTSEKWARERMASLGLAGRADDPGYALSLGQEKRVVMSRTLSSGGRVMLFDEPLAGLDNLNKMRSIQFIRDFMLGEGNIAIITEHKSVVAPLLPLISRGFQLLNGRLVPLLPGPARSGGFPDWRDALKNYLSRDELEELECEEVRLSGDAWLLKLRRRGEPAGGLALEVVDLKVGGRRSAKLGWDNRVASKQGLSFGISFGEVGVLLAPNGWGKTTLLEAIAGILPSESGRVSLAGKDLTRSSTVERSNAGLRLLRARGALFPSLSVFETMTLMRQRAEPDLQTLASRTTDQLSGGERKRLGLATLTSARVQLVDEPFAGLDAPGLRKAWDRLRPHADTVGLITIPGQMKGGNYDQEL